MRGQSMLLVRTTSVTDTQTSPLMNSLCLLDSEPAFHTAILDLPTSRQRLLRSLDDNSIADTITAFDNIPANLRNPATYASALRMLEYYRQIRELYLLSYRQLAQIISQKFVISQFSSPTIVSTTQISHTLIGCSQPWSTSLISFSLAEFSTCVVSI